MSKHSLTEKEFKELESRESEREFRIEWTIHVSAKTPREAAEKARNLMRGSTRSGDGVFTFDCYYEPIADAVNEVCTTVDLDVREDSDDDD